MVVWLYLLVVLGSLYLVYGAGDRWWPATILLFSPRWLLVVPLVILAPLVIRRRSFFMLIPLLVSALVVFVPLMGLQLHRHKPAGLGQGHVLRVLTYNVYGGRFDNLQLTQLLQESAVDLVALQECPEDVVLTLPRGWHGIQQRGLALFSRYPLTFVKLVQVKQPNEQWPGTHLLHAEVSAPQGALAFCSIHLPSPRFGLQAVLDKYTLLRPSRKQLLEQQTKARWLAATEVQKYLKGISQPLLVVGDFNTPPESILFKEVWGGYHNAFSETGLGYGWTQRVSVRGLPYGARIDHVLTRNGLQPLLCEVGPDMGSDHLPLIADVAVTK
jgi:endonuclease/exonuclease/phosphatase (EEP) superfamily protein YafD